MEDRPQRRLAVTERALVAALLVAVCAPAVAASDPPAVVPFTFSDGHIFVDAAVDGHGPYRFAIDTGAGDTLAADVAATLRLEPGGRLPSADGRGDDRGALCAARLLRVGSAEIDDSPAIVFGFDELRNVEGIANFDGLIGHELFERYVVRIDYAAQTLTLSDPATYVPGRASSCRSRSRGRRRSSRAASTVFRALYDRYGRSRRALPHRALRRRAPFDERYSPAVEAISGWGIGGPVRAYCRASSSCASGPSSIERPVTRLTEAQHGFFTSDSTRGQHRQRRAGTVMCDVRLSPAGDVVRTAQGSAGLRRRSLGHVGHSDQRGRRGRRRRKRHSGGPGRPERGRRHRYASTAIRRATCRSRTCARAFAAILGPSSSCESSARVRSATQRSCCAICSSDAQRRSCPPRRAVPGQPARGVRSRASFLLRPSPCPREGDCVKRTVTLGGALAAIVLLGACASRDSDGTLPSTDGTQSHVPPPRHGSCSPANVRRSCPTAGPGGARCFALVRTDLGGANRPIAGYTPADLQAAYDLPSSTNGTGQTVTIVAANGYPKQNRTWGPTAATSAFRPARPRTVASRSTTRRASRARYPPISQGWDEQQAMDLDMVSATCPNCNILLVEANQPSDQSLGAGVDEAVKLGATIISIGYGKTSNDAVRGLRRTAASHRAASGESGSASQTPAGSRPSSRLAGRA